MAVGLRGGPLLRLQGRALRAVDGAVGLGRQYCHPTWRLSALGRPCSSVIGLVPTARAGAGGGQHVRAGDVAEGSPERFDEVSQFITSQAAPRARGLPGLQVSYWLGDRNAGRLVIIALYDTEENLRASADTVAGWRQQDVAALGGTVVSVNEYEVIA